jgi:hypothetical protein
MEGKRELRDVKFENVSVFIYFRGIQKLACYVIDFHFCRYAKLWRDNTAVVHTSATKLISLIFFFILPPIYRVKIRELAIDRLRGINAT